ncbi:hypothetical protein BKA64DRAFT_754041 [Cadophora sp. MPI-SDFR-AT-0126]|nr:hypothetical protein BKA64DRAFT_754041 [Leotiomycetes sp. MPI-SDFR-AT-0126]
MICPPSTLSSARSPPQTLSADSTAALSSSTPASSLSLHSSSREDQDSEDKTGFPSPSNVRSHAQVEDLAPQVGPRIGDSSTVSPIIPVPRPMNVQKPASPDPAEHVKDDTEVRLEPLKYVDYLSHDWRVGDVWLSWKHIISKRNTYGNSARLENASWRAWTKSKDKLKTVPPESLNWPKDCDVTWLYGPLQTGSNKSTRTPFATPASNGLMAEHNSSPTQKPILKKRSMSETMLQRSLSASSLVKQAAAEVQAQQLHIARRGRNRPDMGLSISDYVTFPFFSRAAPLRPEEEKHIQFDEQVKQWIALEIEGNEEEELDSDTVLDNDNSDSDDTAIIMQRTRSKYGLRFIWSTKSAPAGSICADGITIAMLPSTTLKYREDTLPSEIVVKHNSAKRCPSGSPPSMGYEEYEAAKGLLEKMIDAVNTAKDIAYVIWNVGWT